MWYIVEGLTGREPNCGSVPFAQVEITSPWKLSGLAFPEEFLEQVLSALGTSKDMYVEIATDKEGVILISPMGRGVVVEQVQSYLRCGHWERYAGDVKKLCPQARPQAMILFCLFKNFLLTDESRKTKIFHRTKEN